MMVQRFLCRAPCRRIEVWFWRMPRATAMPSSSLKRRTTCQLNLAEHSTYPHFQVFFTRTDTALRGMKRCRCRSLLLPTTRIGTSLLLPSLQVHVGDLKFNQQHKKKINQKILISKGTVVILVFLTLVVRACATCLWAVFPSFWGVRGRTGGLQLTGSRGLPPHFAATALQHYHKCMTSQK